MAEGGSCAGPLGEGHGACGASEGGFGREPSEARVRASVLKCDARLGVWFAAVEFFFHVVEEVGELLAGVFEGFFPLRGQAVGFGFFSVVSDELDEAFVVEVFEDGVDGAGAGGGAFSLSDFFSDVITRHGLVADHFEDEEAEESFHVAAGFHRIGVVEVVFIP